MTSSTPWLMFAAFMFLFSAFLFLLAIAAG